MRIGCAILAASLLAAPVAAHDSDADVAAARGRAGAVAISIARQTGSSIIITGAAFPPSGGA